MPRNLLVLNGAFPAGAVESTPFRGLLASLAGGSIGTVETTGAALHDGPSEAYNEDAFQYFLEIERKRAEASNRPFLMMMVDFRKHSGMHQRLDAATADKLFSVLSSCLRETDFIGWYREGHIAGAVLTQHGESEPNLADVVRERIGGALRHSLPAELTARLEVRVEQVPSDVGMRSVR